MPYMRGALIGVMFGGLMQVVLLLIYLMVFAGVSTALDDVLVRHWQTWCAILACFFALQTCSAVGCRIMGSYFLCPGRDVTEFDRDALLARLNTMDTGKKSVVHDLVVLFSTKPKPVIKHKSWLWVVLAGTLTCLAMLLWVRAVLQAFDWMWFDNRPIDGMWVTDLFLQMFAPFVGLVGCGYILLWLGIRRAH